MSLFDESDKKDNLLACRICLNPQKIEFITLDEENGWLQLYYNCCGIKLSSQDVPKIICEECASTLKSFNEFKEKCCESDKFWKSCKIEENIGNLDLGTENDFCDDDCNMTLFDDDDVKDFKNETTDTIEIDNINKLMSPDEIKLENEENENDNEGNEILNNENEVNEIGENENEENKNDAVAKIVKVFTCKKCDKNYESEGWYKKHVKFCRNKKQKLKDPCLIEIAKARKCGKAKDTPTVTKPNEVKDENEEKLCGICNYTSTNVEDINQHLDKHWNNDDLECKRCDFVGKDKAATAAHRYNHFFTEKYYVCHICQEKTKAQLSLQFHYRKVHLNKVGGLCSYDNCDQVFKTPRVWKRHEAAHKHPGYICDLCGQKYRHKSGIVLHLQNHDNPLPHVCDFCGKLFARMANLKLHVKNVHTKSKPVKCSHCNKMVKNEAYLKRHLKLIAMKKEFKCEVCSKEFAMNSEYKSHMRTHSNERAFACHICGSRYKHKTHLVAHLRNHTGIKRFECSICNKFYDTQYHLKRHNMVHTGIKPFKCAHCEKAFRYRHHMKLHLKTKHNI